MPLVCPCRTLSPPLLPRSSACPMRLTLLTPGKLRMPWLRDGCELYLERLKHYAPTKVVEVKEEPVQKGLDPLTVKKREADRLIEKLPEGSLLVVLDEHGAGMGSVPLSQWLGRHRDSGVKDVSFVIGGPLGLHPDLLSRAQLKLQLSDMTLPHELVRVILLEQLYRAFTILAGEPYHNP